MRTKLKQVLAANAFPCDDLSLDKLCHYYALLSEWNQHTNLTALTGPSDFIYKHVCDSLFPAKFFDFSAGTSLVDVGTGAGFPGLPLKIIYPRIQLTLVEAAAKKAAFLRHCCSELAVEAAILCQRAETLGQDKERGSYALAITRAVAPLAVVCEYCLPLLSMGGSCLAMKGPAGPAEAAAAANACKKMGGRVRQIQLYRLPRGDERSLIVIDKIGATPAAYPRRPGIPAKKPL